MSILDFSSSNRPAVATLRSIFGITLVGAMLIPVPTMAQDPVAPVPVTVMRRALEAFASSPHPAGYVVLESAFPHTVRKVEASLDSANAMILAAPEGELMRVGPLSNPGILPRMIVLCPHFEPSERECPEPPIDTIPRIFLDSVASLELLLHLKNGAVTRFELGPGVDAVFLTPAAMDKFVWPYLARYGVGYAARQRRRYLESIPIQ